MELGTMPAFGEGLSAGATSAAAHPLTFAQEGTGLTMQQGLEQHCLEAHLGLSWWVHPSRWGGW